MGARRLDQCRTVAEIARMAGMPPRTMRRRLVALDEAHGGGILVRFGTGKRKKIHVTLAALRRAAPQWFDDGRARAEDLEAIREDLRNQSRRINALAAAQREFQRKAREWFERGPK